ncbi:MAG: UDP-N-acetylmuramoyl-L-alanyl-D-glutamate--2,6-diaminopimelate ligase [Candidatus Brocadiia bacterium]
MKLAKLLAPLDDAVLVNFADRSIRGLELDSRKVRPGTLFAVVPGSRCDGTRYVPDAIRRGAAAVLSATRTFVPDDVTLVLVPHVRRALADLCCRFYGHPSHYVRTVGVTGTNGKTTVATLVRSLLAAAGRQAALLSTVVHQIGSRRLPATNTTPEAPQLQAFFADMVERHIGHAVMEVSSHALDQERARGVRFDVGVLTNLAPHEHLDYHGTFEAYRDAKAGLFEALAAQATAVLNADDPQVSFFAERTPAKVITYGLDREADVRASVESIDLEGMTFRLATPCGQARVRSPLIGRYNIQNLLAGTASGIALGIDLPTIAAGIERFHGAPGRLERVDAGQPFTVLVDYAHNHGGLESVLRALRPLTEGRLIVVFGAGGERDLSKRARMGAAAAQHAALTVLTADNSRSERTDDIIRAIAEGMPPDAPRLVEADRREAIRKALGFARPGDLVLIAGKGHETYQELDGVRFPFDDREEARRALLGLALRDARRGARRSLSTTGIT